MQGMKKYSAMGPSQKKKKMGTKRSSIRGGETKILRGDRGGKEKTKITSDRGKRGERK